MSVPWGGQNGGQRSDLEGFWTHGGVWTLSELGTFYSLKCLPQEGYVGVNYYTSLQLDHYFRPLPVLEIVCLLLYLHGNYGGSHVALGYSVSQPQVIDPGSFII